jgi:N-acetylglucosaminyl-diphospho-decaprenol L-rhamnosyltransferase
MKQATTDPADIVAVVLEYHRPETTFRCIKSLADAGVRHVLVQDNSTDDGATRIELVNALKNDSDLFRRTTIIGNNINLGFSAGVNAAISHIKSIENPRYVLLMNNDATVNTVGVTALLETLASDPENALAAPKVLSADENESALVYYNRHFAILTRKKYFGSFVYLSGCCLLLDLEKTGAQPLDTNFFMYGEDVALSHDLQKKGYKLAIAESAKVDHIGSASSVAGSSFYEYHVMRGHLLLTSRIANSGVHALMLWPTRLVSLLARSVLRSARAKSFVPLTALWRALRGIGPARQKNLFS